MCSSYRGRFHEDFSETEMCPVLYSFLYICTFPSRVKEIQLFFLLIGLGNWMIQQSLGWCGACCWFIQFPSPAGSLSVCLFTSSGEKLIHP